MPSIRGLCGKDMECSIDLLACPQTLVTAISHNLIHRELDHLDIPQNIILIHYLVVIMLIVVYDEKISKYLDALCACSVMPNSFQPRGL